MKSRSVLGYIFLLIFTGAAILVYQVDSGEGSLEVSDCIQIEEGALSGLSGLLILESREDGQPSFVLDLATGEKRDLPNLTVHSILGPSRNGLLTYYDYMIDAWMLVDLKNDAEYVMEELGSSAPIAWMDDGRLLIGGDRLQIYDLEDGAMESVISDIAFSEFHERINWSSPLNWDGYSPYRIVPGPDLRYLAIAANGEPGVSLVVWDQVLGREVARLHWADVMSAPQWAPDGTSLITSTPPFVFYEDHVFTNVSDELPYVGGNELIQVGVDGSVRRLTTFTSGVNAVASRYRWSPDGRRIAFSLELRNDDARLYRAVVLEVDSGNVMAFCLPPPATDIAGYPVWSPDGCMLALTFISYGHLPQPYILDIESGIAARIGTDSQVVGWWEH